MVRKAKKTPEVKEEVVTSEVEKTTVEETTVEEPIENLDEEISKVEEKMNVIGKVQVPVYQKSSFIKTKVLRTPPCLYELPEDIRRYLTNKGWGSNVYEKGEEWLEKHHADMKIIEKLKKFISEHYL